MTNTIPFFFVILVFLVTILLALLIGPPEYPALDFEEGECVYHVLDKDTEGLVLKPRSSLSVSVRFSADEGWQYYDPEELRKCENNE